MLVPSSNWVEKEESEGRTKRIRWRKRTRMRKKWSRRKR